MGRPALALLALLAIFSGADAKKTKKLSAAEREERRAKGELLMNAVNLGDREEVERLIEEEDAGKCVNHDAGGGKGAPLRNAAKMGYTRIVDILLQAGADIDQPNRTAVVWLRLPKHSHCQSRPPSPRDDIISSLWYMPELARALTRP